MTAGGYRVTLPTGTTRVARRVTEVVRLGMPAPQLEEWKLRSVVEHCRASYGPEGPSWWPEDTATVLSHWRKSTRGPADRGIAVHRWIAAQLRGETPPVLPPSMKPYEIAWTKWLADRMPGEVEAVETTVVEGLGIVAGTLDALIGGTLIDWKTVDKVTEHPAWPAQRAQLGAYSTFPRILGSDGVARMWPTTGGELAPEVAKACIVRLGATGDYREIEVTLPAARDLWHHVRSVAEAVTGGLALEMGQEKEEDQPWSSSTPPRRRLRLRETSPTPSTTWDES